MTGSVCWFSSEKGFGFLKQDEGGDDLFCHFSAVEMSGYKQLKQGQRVEYQIITGDKGKPQAADVRVIED